MSRLTFAVVLAASLLVACKKKGGTSELPASIEDKDRGGSKGDGVVGGANDPTPDPTGSKPGGGPPDIQVLLDGDMEMTGSMGKDVVRKVMKDNVTKLQFCYEKTLMMNPGIEGKVMAKFTIEPQGSVSDVKCEGVHPDVEECVSKAVKELKFPPSAAKVEVSYPFTFKPA
ncbi:MAG: TonB family protein [Deltaproteobacteria bacterium]|nr:TonB family protein [Deltaproteobacteria bacterium]